jgi:hypothetical protein
VWSIDYVARVIVSTAQVIFAPKPMSNTECSRVQTVAGWRTSAAGREFELPAYLQDYRASVLRHPTAQWAVGIFALHRGHSAEGPSRTEAPS